MIRISHVAIVAVFLTASALVRAGEFAYTCEVRHVYSLSRTGALETFPESALEQIIKKSPFSVSRETGALSGNSATLDTSLAKSTRVINRGSEVNSFSAVADFGTFDSRTHPQQLIEIEEFNQGPDKPFVLMGAPGIITGICK